MISFPRSIHSGGTPILRTGGAGEGPLLQHYLDELVGHGVDASSVDEMLRIYGAHLGMRSAQEVERPLQNVAVCPDDVCPCLWGKRLNECTNCRRCGNGTR